MVTVNFYGSWPPYISQDREQTAEDVLVAAARQLEISPLCRQVFGLRNNANGLWVGHCRKIFTLPENITLQFRLRFKPHSLNRLKILDQKAFEYLFHQVRKISLLS